VLSALQPLRHRNFALVWSAALLSNVGSWMQTVAVGVLVTARTGEAGWTGLVAAAAFLPIGLLSPLGGVLADRLDRRRWLCVTTVGETAFAVALTVLVATGHASPAVVTMLVFGGGAMAAIGFPAYQAMLPDLVPRPELASAISLSSAQFNLGRVIGPVLAGLAIVVGGYSWAFAINAVSFVAVLVALCVLRLRPTVPGAAGETLRRRLAEGAQATAASPAARLAVLLISVVALTASPFIALVPAVALKLYASQATGTTVLITAQGVGAVLGALALTPLVRRFGRRTVLLADLVVVCAALVAYGLAPDLVAAAAALLVVGASYIGVLTGCNTIIQLHAPPALRGRMLGIYMMALGILYPVGALAQGAIADVVGLRAVIVTGAVTLLVVAVGLLRRWMPDLDPPAPAADPGPLPEQLPVVGAAGGRLDVAR
jgi:MFS family permease